MSDADQDELLARIVAEPDALEPRMVYADFLTERGDARGELIQIQCRLAEPNAADPALQRRLDEILEEHQDRWLMGPSVIDVGWDRGFVRSVRAKTSWVAQYLRPVSEAEPFFNSLSPVCDGGLSFALQISQNDALERMRNVDLTGCRILPPELQWLIGSPHLVGLATLAVVFTGFERPWDVNIVSAMVRDLTRNPALVELKRLRIEQCGMHDEAMEVLASAPLKVEALALLGENRMTDRGVSALTQMTSLRELRLGTVADLTDRTREKLIERIDSVVFDAS